VDPTWKRAVLSGDAGHFGTRVDPAELKSHDRCKRSVMRRILALTASVYVIISTAAAQAPSGAASKSELLSMDQQIKIAQLITKLTPPLTSAAFSIAMDRIVPAAVELHPLPPEAERLAPQLRGFGYVVVEEQIALVDQRTRRVALVFPRWG
jgi:Protein of unknown function (DUF1236)